MRKMKKWILAAGTALLCGAQALPVAAAPEKEEAEQQQEQITEVKQQKEETEESLEDLTRSLQELENKKKAAENEIDTLDGQLVTTLAAVESLEQQIREKEEDLEETGEALESAEADRTRQYQDMQDRLRSIYEQGSSAGWLVFLLEEGDLSELLNRAEYTRQMYAFDRECLEEYADTVSRVQKLEEQQKEEMSSLQAMKNEQREQQKFLEQKLKEKKEDSSGYEKQMKEADQKARDYQKLIEEYNQQIRRYEEAQRAAAAANAAAANAAAAAVPGRTAADVQEAKEAFASILEENWTEEEQKTEDFAKGKELIEYALQFVGNPYVWGGNSLTEGTDCSGFIHLIYEHFDYSVDRQSAALRDDGKAVSYAEARPGDIICYSGHVALYMGGGTIVHAANENAGITVGSASFAPILSVRRIIGS